MADTSTDLTQQYDKASGRWRDKMRTLGYYDAYLGFLSQPQNRVTGAVDVLDIGAGTGAFAEAWVAVNGAPRALTLLEPSAPMLARAAAALNVRSVQPKSVEGTLENPKTATPGDEVLVAHVIEHCPDPLLALKQIRSLTRDGGRLHLVVSKPHWCNAIIWLQWRHRTFKAQDIQNLLAQADFEVEQDYTFPSGPPSRTSYGLTARAI
ncbi:MAG: methyltransferase domain-containing protein [Paracoccaceae bacterium]